MHMNRQQTSNLLERMFYSLLANYSISMICALTLVFLVNIVHYYAIPQFEPVKYSFLNVVIQRVAGILSYISLYIISKKCRSQKLIVSINIIVPIAIFEFTTYVLNYWGNPICPMWCFTTHSGKLSYLTSIPSQCILLS
jgi:hypothetical protein